MFRITFVADEGIDFDEAAKIAKYPIASIAPLRNDVRYCLLHLRCPD